MQLLCQNDVNDFAKWKQHFDSDSESRRSAGLTLLQMWQEVGNETRVFFLFEVNDEDKARAFIDNPRFRQQSASAGVKDGACYFLDTL